MSRVDRSLGSLSDADWNVDFAYVAGYTSGGASYGVTWEEPDESPLWSEDDEEPIDERPVES